MKIPLKEYVVHWESHLSSFWVPLILAIIFLSLAVHALVKDRNIRMCILYVFLMLCCVGYIAWGDSVISKIAGLW